MLTAKTAFITGASRGIGQATAVALARAGVPRFLLQYGSYREGAEETLRQVKDTGADGELLGADLGTEAGIQHLLAAVRPHEADIDILVNNAGSLVGRAKLAESTPELYDRVMNLNVKSVWFLTRAVAPHMATRGSGVIVNVSSIAARTGGGPGATMYAAAKAAVSAMTRGLARELAPRNVRVNAISPGTVDNNFHAVFSNRAILDGVVNQTPQGRLSSNEDMASVIVFLCSDASANIIGQTIEINGGMYMI
jgi:3-oxoacyl-[acyl-carrier protein] reductase